jgi:hypothetical protein
MEGDCQMDHGPRLCTIKPLTADRYAVTNNMFYEFLQESGYTPVNPRNFLKHWQNGKYLSGQEDLPVVNLSRDDAASYAAFYGKRLPSEEEWQYLAGGPEKLRWPWGNTKDYRKCNVHGSRLEAANSHPEGVSPFGLYNMCGNVWEFTSERHYDGVAGHTEDHCFITLRGGSYHTGSYYWHTESGAIPNDCHLKMHLLGDAMDRLETAGFRCVKDAEVSRAAAVQTGGASRQAARMTEMNDSECRFVMRNASLAAEIDWRKGEILEFSNRAGNRPQNRNRPLFLLNIYGKTWSSEDFVCSSVVPCEDKTQEMVSLQYDLEQEQIRVRVHFLNDRRDTIRVLFQVWDGYKYGQPYNCRMKIPLLSELEVNGKDDRFYPPGNPVSTPEGRRVIMPVRDYEYGSDIALPLVICDGEERTGFSVRFPSLSDLNDDGANQNAGKGVSRIETEKEFRERFFRINPDASFNDTLEAVFTGISGGWVEAFDRYRDVWASAYDFSEYQKPDLRWFNECVIHNFSFLYGKEVFDRENQRIDVEGLLRQGEEFGGYDTVTLWNQYPRLGIDSRSQWDFFDDFPGGRAAWREAVERFHRRGVKVFLPYIPWDRGTGENTDSMGDEFARLLADTGADGYQLDTMHDIPPSFREKLDATGKGRILTTQSHPSKGRPLEMITTSWDEFWRVDPMPEADILRFICPVHLAPVISRWLRIEDKTVLINRAMFGGVPIVIWQDIFGRWLPFSPEQKAMLKRYKEVYLTYRSIYQGEKPIPLYPVLSARNLYCNLFSGTGEAAEIYAFYNDSDEEILADGIRLHKKTHSKIEAVLGSGEAGIKNGMLWVRAAPHSVLHLLAG